MPTLFTRIIRRELPGQFVYEDDRCVAFLTIAPMRPGHTLVVPRAEIDDWVDVPADLAAHLFVTSQRIARAIRTAFPCRKVGVMIAGLEVPHVHLHLSPIDALGDLDFENQDAGATPHSLDEAADRIRAALTTAL